MDTPARFVSLVCTLALGCVSSTARPGGDGGAPSASDVRFIGTPDAAVDLRIICAGEGLQPAELGDGDSLPLLPPPQGGFVSFVGARARNLDGHDLRLTVSLRDPGSGEIYGLESRTVELYDDGGWGTPTPDDPSSLANVALCPDVHDADVQGRDFALEVSVRDRAGRGGSASLHVTPRCALTDAVAQALCLCLCAANVVPGSCGG